MNYLFAILVVFLLGSCNTESSIEDNELDSVELKGKVSQESTYYLELSYHQASLENERVYLLSQILAIQEEIENGNEEHQSDLDEMQERISVVNHVTEVNNEILGIVPLRPTPPPRCESKAKPCPVLFLLLDNLYGSYEQFDEEFTGIEVYNAQGELVGIMEGKTEVPESGGTLFKAEIEYDSEQAHEVRITKNIGGQIEITRYQLQK